MGKANARSCVNAPSVGTAVTQKVARSQQQVFIRRTILLNYALNYAKKAAHDMLSPTLSSHAKHDVP